MTCLIYELGFPLKTFSWRGKEEFSTSLVGTFRTDTSGSPVQVYLRNEIAGQTATLFAGSYIRYRPLM